MPEPDYCLALLVIDSCLVDLVLQKKSAQSKVVDVVDDVDSDVDVVDVVDDGDSDVDVVDVVESDVGRAVARPR